MGLVSKLTDFFPSHFFWVFELMKIDELFDPVDIISFGLQRIIHCSNFVPNEL
jgi:hypothetical protein